MTILAANRPRHETHTSMQGRRKQNGAAPPLPAKARAGAYLFSILATFPTVMVMRPSASVKKSR